MDQLLSLAALIVCAVVLLSLYNRRFPGGPRAPRLSMEEARQALDGGAAVTVVDVRTQEEFDGGHIPGAFRRRSGYIVSPDAAAPRRDEPCWPWDTSRCGTWAASAAGPVPWSGNNTRPALFEKARAVSLSTSGCASV